MAAYVRQLQNLATGQRAPQFGQILHYLLVAGVCHVEQRRRQQVVAHKHSHLVVVGGIERRLPPALTTLVDHVVVHEAGGVQQLEAHGGIERRVGHGAVVAGHEQYEHRAHALAGLLPYMGQSLREHAVCMRQRVVEKSVEIAQITLNRLSNQR